MELHQYTASKIENKTKQQAYLFSKKVFALLMFLPIALAFQAQKLPEGSIW